uniref:Conotoxin Vi5.1b n=1 Tax=Conus virgo TaxID=89427 RepID=CT51B_CONVR|nr:RecName: Full=Conotoxin Vi5.1b; Flags: Precursor [Conus virgo]ABW77584.1 tau conotoxin 5.1b [Conus virgo]
MLCVPVFIILFIIIPFAPTSESQPKTKEEVAKASVHDNAERTLQRLWNQSHCCPIDLQCCPPG